MKLYSFFILLVLIGSLAALMNVTAVKTCTNSTNQINTCANATNVINDGINWTLMESTASGPYNGTVNITNYTFQYGVENITIRSNAGYFFTAGAHVVQLRVFNYTANAWYVAGTLQSNAFGWINVSLNRTDFIRNQSVLVQYIHTSNPLAPHTGISVDYLDVGVVEFVNPVIVYPAEGSVVFGQCWVTVSLITYDNIPNESHTASCQMWYSNGALNSTYALRQTLSGGENSTFNFTNISASVLGAGRYRFNCTTTEGATTGYSQSVNIQLTGTAFCPTGTNAATNAIEYPIVVLIILAITFTAFFAKWDALNPFLAPLSNFFGVLALMSISMAMLALYNLIGEAFSMPFYASIFSFMIFGVYLALRLFVMAWNALKAVLW